MICGNCRIDNNESDSFCNNCGMPLAEIKPPVLKPSATPYLPEMQSKEPSRFATFVHLLCVSVKNGLYANKKLPKSKFGSDMWWISLLKLLSYILAAIFAVLCGVMGNVISNENSVLHNTNPTAWGAILGTLFGLVAGCLLVAVVMVFAAIAQDTRITADNTRQLLELKADEPKQDSVYNN